MDACWSFEYTLVGRCSDVLFPASMALTQAVALLLRPQGLKHTNAQLYRLHADSEALLCIDFSELHARIVKEACACV